MNTVRWGILGTGAMAFQFVDALLSVPGSKVQVVAARTQEQAQRFAAQFQIPSAVAGIERLLETKEVDVIYISTPNELHSEHCLQSINAGKAVVCEKPFALTAQEAIKVKEQAHSRGVFCMEAMWTRFAPAVRDAIDLARNGKLGKLQFFCGQLGFPYKPDRQNRLFRQPGGGALLDLGVYPLSLAQAFFGKPIRVNSSAVMTAHGVDEQFAAILTYPNQGQATVAASLTAKLANAASLHGDSAVLQFSEPIYFPERFHLLATPLHNTNPASRRKFSKLRHHPALKTIVDLRNRSRIRTVDKRVGRSGYTFEALEVQRCLQAGLLESPEMPLSETVAVLECMDSIRAQWSRTTN